MHWHQHVLIWASQCWGLYGHSVYDVTFPKWFQLEGQFFITLIIITVAYWMISCLWYIHNWFIHSDNLSSWDLMANCLQSSTNCILFKLGIIKISLASLKFMWYILSSNNIYNYHIIPWVIYQYFLYQQWYILPWSPKENTVKYCFHGLLILTCSGWITVDNNFSFSLSLFLFLICKLTQTYTSFDTRIILHTRVELG